MQRNSLIVATARHPGMPIVTAGEIKRLDNDL
jgi:hypothetical protein